MDFNKMNVAEILDELRLIDNCKIHPAVGVPSVGSPLPPDLEEFYLLCGGVSLYRGAEYSIDVVKPTDFTRANPIIVGDSCEGDISYNWFVIARSGAQYITIDLSLYRLGRCYDSFWDRHGIPGECPIVALNFKSLLGQLVNNQGNYWFWLEKNFEFLGDAYD